jgi:hypothetical protein
VLSGTDVGDYDDQSMQRHMQARITAKQARAFRDATGGLDARYARPHPAAAAAAAAAAAMSAARSQPGPAHGSLRPRAISSENASPSAINSFLTNSGGSHTSPNATASGGRAPRHTRMSSLSRLASYTRQIPG